MKIFRSPDAASVIALLAEARLPCADISEAMLEHFLGCGERDALGGVIGLEVHGEFGLLRSLVVRPASQRAGHGRALVEALELHAAARGVEALYLLTETAARFFSKLGYQVVGRGEVPHAIRMTREFSNLCPDTAIVMFKPLAD